MSRALKNNGPQREKTLFIHPPPECQPCLCSFLVYTEAVMKAFHHHVPNASDTLRRRVSRLKGLCTKTTPGYNPQ